MTIDDNRVLEAISHYNVIAANFDHLIGNIALYLFAFWDELLHFFLPLHRTFLVATLGATQPV
jgi:hypothetical protein